MNDSSFRYYKGKSFSSHKGPPDKSNKPGEMEYWKKRKFYKEKNLSSLKAVEHQGAKGWFNGARLDD